MACCCLEIQIIDPIQPYYEEATTEIETWEGRCLWSFIYNGTKYYIWYYPANTEWIVSTQIGNYSSRDAGYKADVDCPNSKTWTLYTGTFQQFATFLCQTGCECILLGLTGDGGLLSKNLVSNGTYNARPTWTFNYNNIQFYVYFNGQIWVIGQTLGSLVFDAEAISANEGCPTGFVWNVDPLSAIDSVDVEDGDCSCIVNEERIFAEYQSIKLPEIFEEQDRGYFKCCVPMLVLADPVSDDTWKNDVTSAWIKLSDPSDTATILLTKDGNATSYPITINTFPNESNAIYRTIYWKDVLASDGIGCYKIEISFNIGGISNSFTWGIYDLKQYTISNALTTSRIRCIFNLKQQIEGINFTDSNVEDCIRFNGFIGNRQPNMEIDNLIMQNLVVKSVVRENLNQYEIITDPSSEEVITKLTDLYLLSENEMFISDYNAHNHSYKINDIPVIVEESPEIEYIDPFTRLAKLSCFVGDRRKNAKTFY